MTDRDKFKQIYALMDELSDVTDEAEASRLRILVRKICTDKARARPHGAQEYLGNGSHMWDHVIDDDGKVVNRLRVPGGWLYTVHTVRRAGDATDSMTTTFVPIPDVVGYAI